MPRVSLLSSLRVAEGKTSSAQVFDARVSLVVTLLYIVAVVSCPIDDPARLLWLACYPIVASEVCGLGYGRVFVHSLYILPLLMLVGVFNPWLDRQTVWQIGSIVVTRGWLTFASLTLRGLLSYQALLVLCSSAPFIDICRALRALRLPSALVTQLFLLQRYIVELLKEALDMHRARQARGFGRRSYPLRMYAVFAGQLLLRSTARARRVADAMAARGFTGVFVFAPITRRLTAADLLWFALWTAAFVILRFFPPTMLFN